MLEALAVVALTIVTVLCVAIMVFASANDSLSDVFYSS